MAAPMLVLRKFAPTSYRRDNVFAATAISFCRNSTASKAKQDIVKPPNFLKRYIVDHVIKIVNDSSGRLEKAYPTVFQIYKTFTTGLSGFVQDSREYYKVTTDLWSGRSLTELSRRQLEILRQVPRDFVKIIPVLLITLIPGGSVAFPLAYVFPRLLLSHHFWTDQQRIEFWQRDLTHRLEHFRPIMSHMYLLTKHIDNSELGNDVQKIIRKLQHSVNPTVCEVLAIQPLFSAYPYHLDRISIAYVRHLAKCMNMSLRRSKLKREAKLLYYTDMAMLKEGIDNLTEFDLERACFWRGLNPVGLKRQEQIAYLQQWTQVSQQLDDQSISLLLHMPVLFGYCQPTNRELMGGWRFKWRFYKPLES